MIDYDKDLLPSASITKNRKQNILILHHQSQSIKTDPIHTDGKHKAYKFLDWLFSTLELTKRNYTRTIM